MERKGKCEEVGICSLANKEVIQIITDDSLPLQCKECKATLKEVKDDPKDKGKGDRKMPLPKIAIAIAAFAVVGVVIWLLFLRGGNEDVVKEPSIVTVKPEKKPEPEPEPEPKVEPAPASAPVTSPQTQTQRPASGNGTQTYSFGKYEGALVNGQPHGQGTMTYTCRVQIAKHGRNEVFAENGDRFTGTWGNGDIEHGFLRDRNNNDKAHINAGRRPNPYNLANDKCE